MSEDIAAMIFDEARRERASKIKITQNVSNNHRNKAQDEIIICGNNITHKFPYSDEGLPLYEPLSKVSQEWMELHVTSFETVIQNMIDRQGCYTNWYLFVNNVLMFDCTLMYHIALDEQSGFKMLKKLVHCYNVR
tara:strand:+ start:247 stop:651 length:405 start_codon:yes stop_codon:yes gene_type:complete